MLQVPLILNTKTYDPSGSTAGKAVWTERSAGVGTGFSVLSEKFYPLSKANAQRIEHNLNVPVIAPVDTGFVRAGSVLYVNYININIGIGPGADSAARLDLYNRIKDYVATDTFKKGITDLDPAYG